jgi:hypothetical protein
MTGHTDFLKLGFDMHSHADQADMLHSNFFFLMLVWGAAEGGRGDDVEQRDGGV